MKTSQLIATFLLAAVLASCGLSPEAIAAQTATAATAIAASWTATPTRTLTPTNTFTPTASATATRTLTPTQKPTNMPQVTSTLPWETWDQYLFGSLNAIVEGTKAKAEALANPTFLFNSGETYLVRIKATYTGKFQEIPIQKSSAISVWEVMTYPEIDVERATELFAQEGIFIEDGVEYWLAVSDEIIDSMKANRTEGEDITLFIVWAGIIKADDKVDWLFMVTHYE
jgi:hypothetical protein